MIKKPNPSVIFLVFLLAKNVINKKLTAPKCSTLNPIDKDIQLIYRRVKIENACMLDLENLLYESSVDGFGMRLTL